MVPDVGPGQDVQLTHHQHALQAQHYQRPDAWVVKQVIISDVLRIAWFCCIHRTFGPVEVLAVPDDGSRGPHGGGGPGAVEGGREAARHPLPDPQPQHGAVQQVVVPRREHLDKIHGDGSD
eukprot:TRINITY_DN57515_c0_g1_i1.p2 TRINITY_DN57515_c0_g1~~TRINITY_DN57515_c0_g1_i1.p2  ORF type:complete len:121 (-),score=20.16 TRINITY_DN57515_c0_g1_i1:208-570(-)